MPATATIPGVSITEISDGSISVVNSASCIPLLLTEDDTTDARAISSLSNYLQSASSNANDVSRHAVRLYFENGGGPCFVGGVGKVANALRDHPEINLVAAHGKNLSTLVADANIPKQVFFLLDGQDAAPANLAAVQPQGVTNPTNAACYYPPLLLTQGKAIVQVPASTVVAATYCTKDREEGPWRAPANVGLIGVSPKFPVSDADNLALMGGDTGSAINPIRSFLGRPSVIWGARTMAPANTTDWRYVTVRRLFNMVERDVGAALQALVFRPNNEHTWELARSAVENYLRGLWRKGGLLGDKEGDAFKVAAGVPQTMTDDDVNQGKLKVSIQLAALRPAEFVEIQIEQLMARG